MLYEISMTIKHDIWTVTECYSMDINSCIK